MAKRNSSIGEVVGGNVQRLRKEQHLTQTALARMSGITRPTLSRIESGMFDTRLSNVQALAEVLCVEPVELLARRQDESENQ